MTTAIEHRAPALREWAVIYEAVLRGEQIVDLRKGGIHETGKHFTLRAPRFWLYPGYEHQRADLLKPEYLPALDRVLARTPPEGVIRIEGWAELVATAELSDADLVAALDREFIWTRDYAEQRLRWKPKHALHLLVLRAYRLAEPLEVPWREQYRGCTSWAELVDLPADPAAIPSRPVLDEQQFRGRYDRLGALLPAGALQPVRQTAEAGPDR